MLDVASVPVAHIPPRHTRVLASGCSGDRPTIQTIYSGGGCCMIRMAQPARILSLLKDSPNDHNKCHGGNCGKRAYIGHTTCICCHAAATLCAWAQVVAGSPLMQLLLPACSVLTQPQTRNTQHGPKVLSCVWLQMCMSACRGLLKQ